MTYRATINYLNSFINYENISAWPYSESFGLKRLKDFLASIDNPQQGLRCIHVAGSKGKGSTCAFIANILRQAGFSVGLYTSPHLADFRERIRILSPAGPRTDWKDDFSGMITPEELAGLVSALRPRITAFSPKLSSNKLSFFEVSTAVAFLYFKKMRTDFVVLETGLGGRLDATNVINPVACAITPISLEHTQILGKSLRSIAREKAGIIKGQGFNRKKVVVVSAAQEAEAEAVLRARCAATGAGLLVVGKNILRRRRGRGFSVRIKDKTYRNLKIKLLGEHQINNAAMAVAVVDVLRRQGWNIKEAEVRSGLIRTRWPGRCEVISRRPLVVLDGAQNGASSSCLAQAVWELFHYARLVLVMGVCADKDISAICRNLGVLASVIILTRSQNPRAVAASELKQTMQRYAKPRTPIYTTRNVEQARDQAISLAGRNDLILVTGSLFVVGEYRQLNYKHNNYLLR